VQPETPQFMKKLTTNQFQDYMMDPLAFDGKMRELCNLPEENYYSVATWPEERAGEVRVTPGLHRVVRAAKISKSNQT
jgi:hypothetical protein